MTATREPAQVQTGGEVRTGFSAAPRRWLVPPRVGEEEQRLLGADSLLLAQLLWNRGIRTAQEARCFLEPSSAGALGDPRDMRGMPEAVRRLTEALRTGDRIAVYGDYDVDGVAGAAVLVDALTGLGANLVVHLPHRARDGYGVNSAAVRQLAEQGAKVMVTVDCGITAVDEVALATSLGMDVVVTDHHSVPAPLPGALAVINPHQPGCEYSYKELGGGGVAFQLARALLQALLPAHEAGLRAERLAGLAALSTVADIVPLTGENRTIVGLGLAAIQSGLIPGIEALCEHGGRRMESLTAQDLAFTVIPRLNAAGRMGDARDALDVLVAPDLESARETAARLEGANGARRQRVRELLDSVEEEACGLAADGVLVLAGAYPVGLAGLIAARLAERFGVPSIIIEQGDEISRGSARGVEGVHLVRALEACASCLIQFGGHEAAAGFTLRSENIPAFREQLREAVRAARGDAPVEPVLPADGALRLRSIGPRLADVLDRFEPVGAGNPPPTFVSRGTIVRRAQQLDSGHVRFRLAQGEAVCRGIAFTPDFPIPEPGERIDVLYEVERTTWRSEMRVELLIRDARPSDPTPV
jgi:single-stranded-DNA-specific exonuclease